MQRTGHSGLREILDVPSLGRVEPHAASTARGNFSQEKINCTEAMIAFTFYNYTCTVYYLQLFFNSGGLHIDISLRYFL